MRKVVVVDDDSGSLQVVEKRLRADGYEVLTASDGLSGLELIRRERPGVVLLDLMMPRLHGFSVIQEIRSDPLLNAMRILVTSAKAFQIDRVKASELGANGYITKPFDLDELVRLVEAAFEENQGQILVKFWGTRGSIPTPGPSTARYGGNTSCVEIRCGGTILMMDCGSGAREMGLALAKEFKGRTLDLNLFIGHTHWDHIQGFPFFTPAYVPGTRITFYSLRGAEKNLEKVFTGQMDGAYFPVTLRELSAQLKFVELEGDVHVGNVKVSHVYLNHPGIAIGFRIEYGSRSVVYLSDHEAYCRMNGDNEYNRKLESELADFARGTDLYIREAQYTPEEYTTRRSWGHSVWPDALDSARAAGVKKIALFHHDPMHDDDMLDSIAQQCRTHMQQHDMGFDFLMASDHLELNV